ncbi:MAG: type II toxin-antitoxin system RelE/ParE family toxin [Caldilineaceae bacterium]
MTEESPWRIIIQRQAKRQLRRLSADVLKRISTALDEIAKDPHAGEHLQGFEYRKWRVGSWRIIYQIEEDRLIVLVIDLGARGEIYRRLNR